MTRSLLWECPGCECAHAVPIDGPNAWGFNSDPAKPTLTPSVLVNRGRANPTAHVCHVFVRDGQIEFLGDCTHAFAGKTVPIGETWFASDGGAA